MPSKIAIIGINGVPAEYGGFETLAENLVRHHHDQGYSDSLTVYCSAKSYKQRPARYLSSELRYLPISANGLLSIPYDILSMGWAVWSGCDTILLLGVSGAIGIPFLRLVSSVRIIVNVDGIEWQRAKWSKVARLALRASEMLAVRFSHSVIGDNQRIVEYLFDQYRCKAELIAYGGDHAIQAMPRKSLLPDLPPDYALSICRIEPENNVSLILDAFAGCDGLPLVFVGNWDKSAYGRALRARHKDARNMRLLDPIYDPGMLRALRDGARLYVHGHSAGGTNPSLVEAMHFGVAPVAYDCSFNRYTTHDQAIYFKNAEQLRSAISSLSGEEAQRVGDKMRAIALENYTWTRIGEAYFSLLLALRQEEGTNEFRSEKEMRKHVH